MIKNKLLILMAITSITACNNETTNPQKKPKTQGSVEVSQLESKFKKNLNVIGTFNIQMQKLMNNELFIDTASSVLAPQLLKKYKEDSVMFYKNLHLLSLSKLENAATFLRNNLEINRDGLTDCLLNLSLNEDLEVKIQKQLNYCLETNIKISRMLLSDPTPVKSYESIKSTKYQEIIRPYLLKLNVSENDLVKKYEEFKL